MAAFAIAVTAFAFNTSSVIASEVPTEEECRTTSKGDPRCFGKYGIASIDNVRDLNEEGDERDVADSGDEGSTSAASAGDQ